MADIVRSMHEPLPDTMEVRYADMGDGTHALVTASVQASAVMDYVAIAQGTYDASQTAELTNPGARGAYFVMDITTVPGTDTIQLFVDVWNIAENDWYAIAQDDATAATGVRQLLIYPGAVDTDSDLDKVVQLPLPHRLRVRVTHSAASDFVYSVGVAYCV